MKKIIVFLFLIVLIGFALHFDNRVMPLFSDYSEGTCEFMVLKNSNKTIPSFAHQVVSGDNLFVSADIEFAQYLQNQLNDIYGITIYVQDSLENVLNKYQVKICKEEMQDENLHVFGFSPLFDKSIFIEGKKCNLHIVTRNNEIIIGYPIIYGSY